MRTEDRAPPVDIVPDTAFRLETALQHALVNAMSHPVARHNVNRILNQVQIDMQQLHEKVIDDHLAAHWSNRKDA